MNKIIAFANQKGGVGETTLCILFSNYLTWKKKGVVLLDADDQRSVTTKREKERKIKNRVGGQKKTGTPVFFHLLFRWILLFLPVKPTEDIFLFLNSLGGVWIETAEESGVFTNSF